LQASPLDYRKLMLADVTAANDVEFNPTGPFSDTFFTPLDAKSAAKMATSWRYHLGDAAVSSRAVIVAGRAVDVPECTATGVARFHFEELCARPLGPTDYLAIATEFHTVFVDEIPTMTMQTRDQARRFISLIDALYECNTVLFCSAARNAADMFTDVADVDADRYDIMHQVLSPPFPLSIHQTRDLFNPADALHPASCL
jgi:predicted ATPase